MTGLTIFQRDIIDCCCLHSCG